MNDSEHQNLWEESWRRKLSPAEEARLRTWLAAHPERQADWAADARLNQWLQQLPHAPVPSNFTSLVLQAVDRQEAKPARPDGVFAWWHRLLHRPASGFAWAAALMLAGWVGYQQFDGVNPPAPAGDWAAILKAVAPEPALFEDFDAIRQLPPADDEELYTVLSVNQ